MGLSRIFSGLIFACMLAFPFAFSAENLAPVSGLDLRSDLKLRWHEDRKAELDVLLKSIHDIVEGYCDVKELREYYLNRLDEVGKIRAAYARRFNLQSPSYRRIFISTWHRNPLLAIKNLANGYFTKHVMNKDGELILDFSEQKILMGHRTIKSKHDSISEFQEPWYSSVPSSKEFPKDLDGIEVFKNAQWKNFNVLIEWTYRHQLGFWYPIAIIPFYLKKESEFISEWEENIFKDTESLFSPLNVILDKNKKIVKISDKVPQSMLKELSEKFGELIVCSHVPLEGKLSLGSKKHVFTKRALELFTVSINSDGEVIAFNFFEGTEPVTLWTNATDIMKIVKQTQGTSS
jgi:hypothetical protein